MILADLPQVVVDVGAACGVLLTVAGVCALVWRCPAAQRLWHRNVTEPRQERTRAAMRDVIEPLRADLADYGGRLDQHVLTEERMRAEELAAREERQAALDGRLARIDDQLVGIHHELGQGAERMAAIEEIARRTVPQGWGHGR